MIRAARISQFIFASIVTATTFLAPLTSVHADVVAGDVAPEFTAKDSTGKDVSLNTFKGKIVVRSLRSSTRTETCKNSKRR